MKQQAVWMWMHVWHGPASRMVLVVLQLVGTLPWLQTAQQGAPAPAPMGPRMLTQPAAPLSVSKLLCGGGHSMIGSVSFFSRAYVGIPYVVTYSEVHSS
jgi:hypothetical protein